MIVSVSGTLTFQTGKKLKLPCNSHITLSSTGAITGGGGGGSSNLIDICSVTVWTVSMGNLSGPLVLQLNPLPVELAHFSARTEGEIIVLNWLTFSELNNDYYVVEKSKNGIEYKELGVIDGAGTSSNINAYKMIDIIPYHGIQYYRLKQVDFDGKSVTSELIAVKWQKGTECSIYPNPGKGELFANIDPSYDKQKGKLIINNTDGKLVLSKDIQVNGSFYGIKLLQNQEYLKPGSYLVTLTFRDKSFSQYIVSK
jgi:hypothetical protein